MCLSPSDVTVVIPVVNEAGNLKACIESACNAGAIHVVVADGGSQDGSPETVSYTHLTLPTKA